MGVCSSQLQHDAEGDAGSTFETKGRHSRQEQKVLDRIRSQSPYLCFLCRHFNEYDPMLLTRFESLRYISFQEFAQSPSQLADLIVKQCNGISHLAQLSIKFCYPKNSHALCVRGVVWFGDLKESNIVAKGNAIQPQNDAQQLAVDMRTVLNMTWAPLFVDNIVNTQPEKPTLVQTFPLRARLLSPAMIELYNLLQCFLDVRGFGFYPHAGQVHVVIAYRTHRYASIPNTPRAQVQQSLVLTPNLKSGVKVHKDSPALRALLQIPINSTDKKFDTQIRSPVSFHSLVSPRAISIRGKPSRSLITHAAISPRSKAAQNVAQFALCSQHVGQGSPPNARLQVQSSPKTAISINTAASGAAIEASPRDTISTVGGSHPELSRSPAAAMSYTALTNSNRQQHQQQDRDTSNMHSERDYKSPASPIRKLNDYDSKSRVFTRANSSLQVSGAVSVQDSRAGSSNDSR